MQIWIGWSMLNVLLQWNSTSVYTSWTYSTYHLELALGTFIRHFISACLVCHTSYEKICRGCKQIAHVLGNDCDIVFISLKSTENVQRITLSCSYCFTDTVTKVLVAVKWEHLLWKISTFSVTFAHATGPYHFVNAMQVHRSLWVITIVHKFWDPFRSSPPWSPNDMIVTDICQYIICPI